MKASWFGVQLPRGHVDTRLQGALRPVAGCLAYYRHEPQRLAGVVLGFYPGASRVILGSNHTNRPPHDRFAPAWHERRIDLGFTLELPEWELPWHGIRADLRWHRCDGLTCHVLPDRPSETPKSEPRLKYVNAVGREYLIQLRDFWKTWRPDVPRAPTAVTG